MKRFALTMLAASARSACAEPLTSPDAAGGVS